MTAISAPASTTDTSALATGSNRKERLHKAANQFEAMMLQEMLKPLAAKPEDPESASSSDGDTQSGPLQGFGIQAVAESMAKSGALGFAKQIEQALGKRTADVPAAK